MSDIQARLIASGLAMIAGAILVGQPYGGGSVVLIIASVLFVVEYVRAQLSPRRDRT